MNESSVLTALPLPGSRTLVFAHRGAMAYAPQNTMPSFELAWNMGADGIELDVQCTRDGVPVVFHDDALEGLTDGKGPVCGYDFDDLRKLDAGSHFSPGFSGEKIPLLETVFRSRPAGTFVNIEIKTALKNDRIWRQLVRPLTGYPALETGQSPAREAEARRVAAATAECIRTVARDIPELPRYIIVSSFDPVAIASFGTEMPGVPLGFLHCGSVHYDTRPMMKTIAHQAWHPHWREAKPALVSAAHEGGQRVNCWTVNSGKLASRLAGMRVDGIITNVPDAMLKLLGGAT